MSEPAPMRDEASARQVRAARPDVSTWLSANAGAGKTRVLTDRVARLLLQGTEDPYVYSDQAIWMYQKLRAALVEARLVMIQGAGHGFRGDDREYAMGGLFEFLDAHLKP